MSAEILSPAEKYIESTQREIQTFRFDRQQANLLHKFSEEVAAMGGPQAAGARMKAALAATELRLSLSHEQHALTQIFSEGKTSALVFEGMNTFTDEPPPDELPTLPLLENRHDILCLASRNQILLKLVEHKAFAYDIDNGGKIVRLVANFKGGGLEKIHAESEKIELSSHSGLSLGPHTEAPYWCALKAENGHSPSPSALILTSLWNPRSEPTSLIPLPPLLDKIGVVNSLALTSRNFNFSRSDSFVDGKGEDGKNVSILKFNEKLGFTVCFNSYRFSVDEKASTFVKSSYQEFCQAVGEAVPYQYALSQSSAVIINNNRALHCRDIVKDNRRLLVRLFGLSKYAEPIVISEDPILVRG